MNKIIKNYLLFLISSFVLFSNEINEEISQSRHTAISKAVENECSMQRFTGLQHQLSELGLTTLY